MTDTRLIRLIFAVFLIAVSTAKPSVWGGPGEAARIKQLLEAVKRHLHDKDDALGIPYRAVDARDDVRTFYDACKISLH